MKKKLLAILLSLSIPFSLISCNTNNITNEENSNSTISDNSTTSKDDVENNEINKDTDQSKKENVKVYYYNGVSDEVVYINTTIEAKSDKIADSLIDELKTSPNSDISPALSNDILLNSCTVDTEKSLVTLDFSSNFVEAQNLGAGAESSTLTAICNTFGSYFNVDNVIINLDGKPYSSGHIIMSEGEAFKVDLNNAIELK
ncbi:GerMN domain-containing protein [Clostridium nigeriense]|uniref:GerMN domain-containing protein n=1 Tax=Clostridium nigeriense TaxID=1805470 RepID=UPI003D352809